MSRIDNSNRSSESMVSMSRIPVEDRRAQSLVHFTISRRALPANRLRGLVGWLGPR